MSPWRPAGETGRILNELYGLYGITAADIQRHGGPDTVTLSRLKRQPDSVPRGEVARQNLARRIVDAYSKAITGAYGERLQLNEEAKEKIYRMIKRGLDQDATFRLPHMI